MTALIISYVQKLFAVKEDPIVEKIDKLLPQTQCGQCGYPGCLPYAQALANGDQINKCTPGGQELVVKLAELLDVPVPEGEMAEPPDLIAIIDEPNCVGCLKCIEACPVDAIIGARRRMHVIIPDYCTGCELCVAPCPTKCISMIERPKPVDRFSEIRKEINLPRGLTAANIIPVANLAPDVKLGRNTEAPAAQATAQAHAAPAAVYVPSLANAYALNEALGNQAHKPAPSLATGLPADSAQPAPSLEQVTASSSSESTTKNADAVPGYLSLNDLLAAKKAAQAEPASQYSSQLVARLAAKLAQSK